MDFEIYTMYSQTIYIQTLYIQTKYMLKHFVDLTRSITAVKVHKLGQIQRKFLMNLWFLALERCRHGLNSNYKEIKYHICCWYMDCREIDLIHKK